MRETPEQFEARTGRLYAPDDLLRALGEPLADDLPCPTLFRYCGPCGLAGLVGRGTQPPGGLGTLGPPDREVAWLSDVVAHSGGSGAVLFGTVAVLQPLASGVVSVDVPPFAPPVGLRGERVVVYAVRNTPIDGLVWVPPSKLWAPIPWDAITSAAEACEALGDLDAERHEVAHVLGGYLAEIEALKAAGAAGPGRPWCDVPPAERTALRERYGVAASFSATT